MKEPLYRATPDKDAEFVVASGRVVKAVYDKGNLDYTMHQVEFKQVSNIVILDSEPDGQVWVRFKKQK